MRFQPYVVFGIHTPELDRITLTAAERATFRKAAEMVDQLREMRDEHDEGHDEGIEFTDLGLGAAVMSEAAERGWLEG